MFQKHFSCAYVGPKYMWGYGAKWTKTMLLVWTPEINLCKNCDIKHAKDIFMGDRLYMKYQTTSRPHYDFKELVGVVDHPCQHHSRLRVGDSTSKIFAGRVINHPLGGGGGGLSSLPSLSKQTGTKGHVFYHQQFIFNSTFSI